MKNKVINKLKELEEQYDMWLESYDRDGLEYQENKLNIIREQINVLKELLEGGDENDNN